MDKRLRRSLVGGFNAQDVVAYINRLTEQHRSETAELRRELERVTEERNEAVSNGTSARELEGNLMQVNATLEKTTAALERAVSERDALAKELGEVRVKLEAHEVADADLKEKLAELESVKARVTNIELEAQERAQNIKKDASDRAEYLRSESERVLNEARIRAQSIEREAMEKAEALLAENENLLSSARARAQAIEQAAQQKAESTLSESRGLIGEARSEAERTTNDGLKALEELRGRLMDLLEGLDSAAGKLDSGN